MDKTPRRFNFNFNSNVARSELVLVVAQHPHCLIDVIKESMLAFPIR
jgi:hypothetical protein